MIQCKLVDLKTVDYVVACRVQKDIVSGVIAGNGSNTLITCQHPNVITLSRRAEKSNILADEED